MGYTNEYYKVSKVKGIVVEEEEIYYLIKWETGEETWEPEDLMIQDIPELIDDFHKDKKIENYTTLPLCIRKFLSYTYKLV